MNTDDPKFTAHILGELDELTAAERAEIEALIRADATAAAERAETQALAALLRRELQGEEAQPLTAAQRATVLAATAPGATGEKAKVITFPNRLTWLSAIAACLIVGVSMALIFRAFEPGKSASGTAKVGETSGGPTITLPREPEPGASLALVVPDVALAATADGSSPEGLTAESQALIAQQMHASPPPMSAPKVATPAQSPRLAKMAKAPAPAPSTSQPIADETHVPAVQGAPTKLAGNAAEPQMPASTKTDSAASGAAAPNGGNQLFALEIPAAKTAAGSSPLDSALSLRAHPSPPPRPASIMAAEAQRGAGQGFAMGGHGGAGKSDKTKSAMTGASAHLQGAGLHDGESYRRHEKDAAEKPGAELRQREPANTEAFDAITDNAFLAVRENPLSTFSIDVDTASYAIVRRFLNERQLPPKGAVRIEELLNYFTYDYPQPQGDAPFSATMEVATCPWTPAHRLVRIGLKGREIAKDKRPASNLVFLIDVSGSMQPANRLPLLKQSLGLLIDQLGEEDRVGIVVYAGSSGCVLQPTHDKAEMRLALERLIGSNRHRVVKERVFNDRFKRCWRLHAKPLQFCCERGAVPITRKPWRAVCSGECAHLGVQCVLKGECKIFAAQHAVTLSVDGGALHVDDVVKLHDALAHIKVVAFNARLGTLNGAAHHCGFQRLALIKAEAIHEPDDAFTSEAFH